MVQSLAWNDENNMLVALTDGKLIIFYYPNVAYVDKYLLPRTVHESDAAYVRPLCLLLSCKNRLACCIHISTAVHPAS